MTVKMKEKFSGRVLSVSDVASRALGGNDYGNYRVGVVEAAERTTNNVVEALGKLIEALCENATISSQQVKHILDIYGYEMVEDE